MGAKSKIEWTSGPDGEPGATWNPLRGCFKVSAGCKNCYAEAVASRFSGPGQPYEDIARDGRWTGRVELVREHLADPLRWRRPRRVFVNSMSDVFHEDVPDEVIAGIFGVIAASPRHTFQLLTKRADRMARWFRELPSWASRQPPDLALGDYVQEFARGLLFRMPGEEHMPRNYGVTSWPLPNVWLGVSVEDQRAADERIPHLLQVPAAVRFLSVEPLIGPVDLTDYLGRLWECADCGAGSGDRDLRATLPRPVTCATCGEDGKDGAVHLGEQGLHWVIVGGESGTGARPCEAEWIRKVMWDCRAASVPCFVKQLGAAYSDPVDGIAGVSLRTHPDAPSPTRRLRDRKGGDMEEWPTDLRVREFPVGRV